MPMISDKQILCMLTKASPSYASYCVRDPSLRKCRTNKITSYTRVKSLIRVQLPFSRQTKAKNDENNWALRKKTCKALPVV